MAIPVVVSTTMIIQGCGGGVEASNTNQTVGLSCDDGIKTAFKPDSNTTVQLVKLFKKGDSIALSNTPTTPAPPVAAADLCLVKLLVGPGNPGPASAPSTSAGIGIEVWLPTVANWNGRIRAYGNGGWAGSAESDVTNIGDGGDGTDMHVAAAGKGYVVATSDHGHMAVSGQPGVFSGSFAMNPDGTLNTVLLKDFSERSLHEMAVKTKALVKLFYGRAQTYAYWDGYSTGGKQGLRLAQLYPDDFDGILAGAPAINWTRFLTSDLYAEVAMQRELGGPISADKLTAVTSSAIAACGGSSLGFLVDPYACHYDPTKDPTAICAGATGNSGIVGKNTNATTCLKPKEAEVVNQIWYGQTSDGSVADPAADNASGPFVTGANHLWFGPTRGTSLLSVAGVPPFPIAPDTVALEMRNPTLGSSYFINALGVGQGLWVNMDYSDLAFAAYQGLSLQPQLGNLDANDPDLSAFNAHNGKLILYHGLADNVIEPQGSDNYYNRVADAMGGIAQVQSFFRYFHIPGLQHSGRLEVAPNVPAPQTALGRDEMFQALQAWVEHGTAPVSFNVTSPNGAVSMPLCMYPQKATTSGNGAVTAASSYVCQ
ncbi:tannase/feruloyl esterase family alpha/beta hydrolase [Burkholderia cepacia]|uniref:tannase/feruloyl esterase family alpha/beta hydrolase n=1 Tax=Burkholderia cepacia TaxID=292 RepID=UPI001E64435A|nr:tannase/feruloyl esterase family alpha/beta hydrolase [Burkholderia cepacia]